MATRNNMADENTSYDDVIGLCVAVERWTPVTMTSLVYVYVWDEMVYVAVAAENGEHQLWWCHRFMCTFENYLRGSNYL